jgi:hypothetical protein
MPKDKPKQHAMRKIATDLTRKIFRGELAPQLERDLVTSLVRQWISYEGRAALFTGRDRYWFTLSRQPGGITSVEVGHIPQPPLDGFLQDWEIDPELAPEIIHRLNLGQSAEFTNRYGERLRLRVDPVERSLQIEPAGAL